MKEIILAGLADEFMKLLKQSLDADEIKLLKQRKSGKEMTISNRENLYKQRLTEKKTKALMKVNNAAERHMIFQ